MEIQPQKIKNTSKILHGIFVVFYWVGLATTVIGCLFYLVHFFLPDAVFKGIGESGRMGISIDNTIYFKIEPGREIDVKALIRSLMPFALVIMGLLLIGIRQVMHILRSVSKDNPFDDQNASRLSIIGFDLLIASLVVSVARTVSYSMVLHMFGLTQIRSNFSIDPALCITGFLVLILSGVFKYGNYLKKEYDATI